MSNYAVAMMTVATRDAVIYLFEGMLGLELMLFTASALVFGLLTWLTAGMAVVAGFTFWGLIDFLQGSKEAWRAAQKAIDVSSRGDNHG